MPFDGAGFVREPSFGSPSVPLPSEQASCRLAATALPGFLRLRRRRSPPADADSAVVRLLREARAQIASPQDWVQGTYETTAGRRCAVGALFWAAQSLQNHTVLRQAHMELLRVAVRRGFPTVEIMNDTSWHKRVLSAFDEAIAAARQRASG